MRFVTYLSDRGARAAGVRDGMYVDLADADASLPSSVRSILEGGHALRPRVEAALARGGTIDPATVRLAAPISDPRKIVCVGLNYADHAHESGVQPPSEPVIFNKFPTTLTGHLAPIVLPRVSHEVDFEAELVVAIGHTARHVAAGQAMQHVAGYTCGHDVSARDWQLRKDGKQWLLGKSFDTFAPCGPWLVTPDEVADPHNLRVQFRLNGRTLQDSNTNQFIFKLPELIEYVSQVCTLEPGDLIFTGTPPGVGFARKPPIYLQPGDIAEVEVEGLGILRNPVVAEVA
ncbi:MAG: fumarylacetoacetate hydrolase family protein [Pirellulales bacterium]|nr:fumarylacetoacetate hydrolase family protein [Pirellulales bacterium]